MTGQEFGDKTHVTKAQVEQATYNYERLTMSASNVNRDTIAAITGNCQATMSTVNCGEVYDPVLSANTGSGRRRWPGSGRGRKRVMVPMHRICLFYRLNGDDPTRPERVGFMTVLARDWQGWS